MKSIDLLSHWMVDADTDPDLQECIIQYARGRGTITMSNICQDRDPRFQRMAMDHDKIGWRRFMECMVPKGLQEIQSTYSMIEGSNISPEQWMVGVIIKLMETTHGQWLYRCIQVHNKAQSTQATLQKEELQKEIETQQDLGYEGLLEEDQYLAEVNLEDLETSSGERQEYWLVAICAARKAFLLRGASQLNAGKGRSAREGHVII